MKMNLKTISLLAYGKNYFTNYIYNNLKDIYSTEFLFIKYIIKLLLFFLLFL